MLFCEECGTLKQRRRAGDSFEAVCPKCSSGSPASSSSTSSTSRSSRPASRSEARRRVREAARKRRDEETAAQTGGPSGGGQGGDRRTEPPRLDVPDDLDLFPFEAIREGQDRLMGDARRVIREGRHLVAYAPTGLGKTVATLVPAVEHALRHDKRVFFLTSKQSQHRIAVETLARMRARSGVPFVVGDVIGKQDMCARSEADGMGYRQFAAFCRREQALGTCSYWEADDRDAVQHLASDIHSVEEIVDRSSHRFGVCPHRAGLNVARQAHVVVCDYNYFFSEMRDSMAERLNVERDEAILIVDEAHNLPDRIRDHLTLRLTPFLLDDAIQELDDLAGEGTTTEHLQRVLIVLKDLLDHAVRADPPEGREWDGEERLVDRDEWIEAVEEHLAAHAERLGGWEYDEVVEEARNLAEAYGEAFRQPPRALGQVREFLRNWQIDRRGLVRVLERGEVPAAVYALLDPAILSRGVFADVHASVLMSGTLYPTRMYRDVLGLGHGRTDLREYDDPFPEEHRRVVVDRSVTTRYEDRDAQMIARIGQLVADVARATPGNVAAFLPSYNLLERVRRGLPSQVGDRELLIEERAQGKQDKEAFLDALAGGDRCLLLGVLGGSMSEGVDYPGDLLEGVIVVGVPFARPTLTKQALIDHYKEKFGGRGWHYAYVYPAMNRVLQAAGRPIRSAEDRAVVVLADERFTWSRYRKSLPGDLRPEVVDDARKAVEAFWATPGRG